MSPRFLGTCAAGLLLASSLPAAPRGKMENPDFTKGDAIPEGANHDWTLGATGARGWIYSEGLVTSKARQIAVTKVDAGSPADGILQVGDVILGVAGKPFSYDPREEFGRALTHAETEEGGGKLSVIRWRKGSTQKVVVQLPVLGTYSATAPFDCAKSKKILGQGCANLAKRVSASDYKQNAISRSLNALALLASGNPEYLPLVKREAAWAAEFSADSMATWWYGYVIMLLAEYVMATDDMSVMPGLERLAREAATGQSIVGSWGHRFAGPDGRLLGYGMMNAPGLPLTTSLVMARGAGVDDPEVALAIERSAKLLRFYAGKGAVPYGDHHPWIETHDDNGKNGMAAVLFSLMGESDKAKYFSRMSVASHGPERDIGHTGNFWNMTWAMPGVAQSGPHATGAWMNAFGAWYFDLARTWEGQFPHQGPPQKNRDATENWDATGSYLLAYAMPLQKIWLTGKKPSAISHIDAIEAGTLIEDGVGWSNLDRTSYYDQMHVEELLYRLGSWSPVVRERAAMAIARQKEAPLGGLMQMLDHEASSLHARLGACQAFAQLRAKAAPAVPTLIKTLDADDLWLRIKAADALAAIGEAAAPAVPRLLEMLATPPGKEDPRGMEQRYLCFALFDREGLVNATIDQVDRDLLYKAVRAGLQNEDGRARSGVANIYQTLDFEELKPLLPAIHKAIVEPSPSGIMFADGVRMSGLQLFTNHRIDENIELLANYVRHMKPHASEHRIGKVLEMLETYGAHAQRVIPQLEASADYFTNDEPDFPKDLSLQKAKDVREAIARIMASTEKPQLVSLKEHKRPACAP